MTDPNETAAVVALLRRRDRLWHHYADLVETAGSALAVLRGDYVDPTSEETPALFDATPPPPDVDLGAIVEELEMWEAEGVTILTVLDDGYPENLRTIHNRPPILFVLGKLQPEDHRSIAVVGTRRASEDGLRIASGMAASIGEAGFSVVSGLAEGIDSAGHREALRHGYRTVAVIGTGTRRTYPAKNADLQAQIAHEGAVISQFWPDAPPTKTSFPMRNVVMSGFALATVVIEASGTSGARQQAGRALEHGRPVFLHERLLEHEWAREYSERPGAHVVSDPAEVLERVEALGSAVDQLAA